MSLSECMRSHTERERDLWLAWLCEEWNHPSLTDHYLMQVSRDVVRKFADNPNAIQSEQSRIRFITPLSPEEVLVIDEEEKERIAEEHRRNVSEIARQELRIRIAQGVKKHQEEMAKKAETPTAPLKKEGRKRR